MGHSVLVVGPGGVLRNRRSKFDYPLHRWFKIPFVTSETNAKLHLGKTGLLHSFDLIHAHNTYPAGYTAAILKDRLKKPLVITPHGIDINIDRRINHGLRLDPAIDQKIQFALSRADAITAISDQVNKSLQNAGVDAKRITPLPNGVDVQRFQKPQSIDAREYFNLSSDSELIVTIGNYHRRKGHELLIQAVRDARECNRKLALVIVGATSDALKSSVESEGLQDWVKFAGTIRQPKPGETDIVAGLLQSAKAYVSSSISNTAEGMSLAVLEAMAAGACVIASNISGSADLLADGKYGLLVPANDAGALSKGILDVVTNNELRSNYQSMAAQRAREFSWEDITRRYLEVYESVLA
jgi:glycosyltransferase involved in cell wall biosynthesis